MDDMSRTIEMVGAKQAASLLKVSCWTLYEYCKAGRIPHIRVGRMLRFRVSTIRSWLATLEADSISRARTTDREWG